MKILKKNCFLINFAKTKLFGNRKSLNIFKQPLSNRSLLRTRISNFSHKVDYSYDTRDFLKNIDKYEETLGDTPDLSQRISIGDDALIGNATEVGTLNFTQRNKDEVHKEHFKTLYGSEIKISSIGLGTYMGPPDDLTDFYVYNAVKSCVLSGGVNVIDTAINYRYMKSEIAIGKALLALCTKYEYSRDELFVCSKIGYVPENADLGHRSHFYIQHLIEGNKITMDDVIFDDKKRPVHCIHPDFLSKQLDTSLGNLKLKTLDVLYLHNVFESQGAILDKDHFEQRLSKAFEFCEHAKQKGKIKFYGLASWNSFRTPSTSPGLHANLQDIVKIAEKVGSKDHAFKFIQVPINIMNPEAFVENYQNYHDDNKGVIPVTLTAACAELKINLISCSPLLQGYITNLPLENVVFNVKNNSAKHLQLIRSIPAESLKCTLVGMKAQTNIRTNLEVMGKPPLNPGQFYDILAPKKREPFIEKDAK